MGRYRRGHRNKNKRGQNPKRSDGPGSLTEADWILMEKYLVEYRTRAYDLSQAKQKSGTQEQQQFPQQLTDYSVEIGVHKFLPLTTELCKRPYIDLPDTLGGRERRKIHALCAALDLYHAGAGGDNNVANSNNEAAGTNKDSTGNIGATKPALNRRIAISIYADGLYFVPDIEPHRNAAELQLQSFPASTCRPWYNQAYGSSKSNGPDGNGDNENCPFKKRMKTIELQKQQIRQFFNLPEKSLRTSEGGDESYNDSLDLKVLDSFDLSKTSTTEETPWMLVDTVDKLKLCVDELVYGVGSTSGDDSARSPKIRELGFDLEMYNPGPSSRVRTCLIQLTSDVATSKGVYKDYIVDPLAPGVWDAIPIYLGPIYADPKIVKIGHGIGGMDTSSLHRDFGILVVNAFDTYEASCILSPVKRGMGLAALCRHYGLPSWEHYKELKHKYQTSDWRKRPLNDGSLEYGRYDIRFLVQLRKLLMRDLVKMDMLGASLLRFGSSIEDDSGLESAPTDQEGASRLQSFDSQLGTAISSTTASSSEDGFKNTDVSSSSLGAEETDESFTATENASGAVLTGSVESGDTSLPISSVKSMIYASEFPCYHHLMKAISMSQKRCLKLWSGDDEEPILRNPMFLSMVKQAANQRGHGKHWSDANMQLYKQLAEWRVNIATQEVYSVADVCSLELLVHVAYKLPSNRFEMQRFSHVLPALVEDRSLPYCDELCELVTSSDAFARQKQSSTAEQKSMPAIFYSCNAEITKDNQEQETQKTKTLKLLLGSAVIGAILFAVIKAKRR